ncbi:DUF1266 domain-containing protein [uncultured Oscillibacter sp.]|uniref:DUF1266 domain-containing protein n=1 Tax=uncultured Oscillibacter sp. TaxID=876091 RepID=UPI0025FF916D|nr:stalk domain-containing protein [uncultured Oscillibacter sp.]
MKRLLSMVLSLWVLLALALPAASAAEASPAPPAWVDKEEYLVLPGDSAYEGADWERILRLREDAAAGHVEPQKGEALYADWDAGEALGCSAAMRYELGLIGMKYAENAPSHRCASRARRYFSLAQSSYKQGGGDASDPAYYLMQLWYLRARLLECAPTTNQRFSGTALNTFLQNSGYTMEQFLDYPALAVVSDQEWEEIWAAVEAYENRVEVWVDGHVLTVDRTVADGKEVYRDADPEIVNGTIMVSLRWVAERLGADVTWVAETQAARVFRAGVNMDFPVGKTTAYRDGVPVELGAATYTSKDRTMVPVLRLAELMGQRASWDETTRRVEIWEDKTAAEGSNLEAWALAMGAVRMVMMPNQDPAMFGGMGRAEKAPYENAPTVYGSSLRAAKEYGRAALLNEWGISDRAGLIELITRMTDHGHNDDFLADVAWIAGMKNSEYQQILRNAQGMDVYMFPFTKQLGEKWGETGILAWDLSRMSNLAQYGYTAGFLTYEEALAILEPAAKRCRETFSSWETFYENYLDGYNWWARNDVLGKDPWTVTRGTFCKELLERHREVLDDGLFKSAVRGVDGYTAEALLASVQ